MPVRLTIEKHHIQSGNFWTNVYYMAGGTALGDHITDAEAIMQAERSVLPMAYTITKYRLDDGIPDTDNFWTSAVNLAGQRNGGAASNLMPLFAVARVDFSFGDGGRPGRKFLKCLFETDVNGWLLEAALVTQLQAYAATVVGAGILDPQGNIATGGSVYPSASMRQLRRGSKKKDTQSSPGTTP